MYQEWKKPKMTAFRRNRLMSAFAALRRVDPMPALRWECPKRVRLVWWPADDGCVEEIVGGASVEELFQWSRESGLMDFSPPSDYEPRDTFG